MVAILQDLIFKLRFLCTPMPLESVAGFALRTTGMEEETIEQEMMKITDGITAAMGQRDPIPSALPPSLMDSLNNSYIRHLSPIIGVFGCDQNRREWKEYEAAYTKYSAEVEKGLAEKVASVVEDSTEQSKEHPALKQINDHLVVKWQWLNKGIFDGNKWSTTTHIPLLTQAVIKHLDAMVDPVISAFEEVRKSKLVWFYVI